MTVKKVKVIELMNVLLAQLALGVQYIDIQAINEDTIRISPAKEDLPPNNTEPNINQTIV